MSYQINADIISLDDLARRIETTDLVPSRASLLNELNIKMNQLEKQGIGNLAELRIALKNPKKIETLAQESGIDKEYLILLRREIESYFPKPCPLRSFDWLPQEDTAKLEKAGIKDSLLLYQKFADSPKQEDFAASYQINGEVFRQLSCLCDLVRMQWTSPLAARMLLDAGYASVQMVASADPETLCSALIEINEGGKYFKGNIGLRDIKRLVKSAGYL